MKLERNNPAAGGRGKYAVVSLKKLDALAEPERTTAQTAIDMLIQFGVLTYGEPGAPDEFFVMMLKDSCARPALLAYAGAASVKLGDKEYSGEVFALAARAGCRSAYCKDPD